jgi:hypothetical protein
MTKLEFSEIEKETLKEYSRICLACQEQHEKLKVLKNAKKMYETVGMDNHPSVYSVLGKVDPGKSILVKDVGVELKNVKKTSQIRITKPEMLKRLNNLLDPTSASVVYTNLTDKRFKDKEEKMKVEWNLIEKQ